MKMLTLSLFVAAAALSGCGGGGGEDGGASGGGGDDSSTPPPAPPLMLAGMFLDSAVEGLTYQSGSNPPGTTDENGTFMFTPGETLTFSVGGVEFGTLPSGATVITPFDFGTTAASNIARFLQTLDADGDPSNGIDLIDAATALASTTLGDAVFLSDGVTFANAIGAALETALGSGATLVDEATALAHLVAATSAEFAANELAGRGFVAVFPGEDDFGLMNFAPLLDPEDSGSTVVTMWRNDTLNAGGDGTTTVEDWSVDGNGILTLTNPIEMTTVTIEKVGSSLGSISIVATEAPAAEPIIGTLLVPAPATVSNLASESGRTYSVASEGDVTEATFLPDGTVSSIDDGNLSIQPWEVDSNSVLVSVFDVVDTEINLFVLFNGSYTSGGDVLLIGATNLSGNTAAPILQLDNMSVGTLTPNATSGPGSGTSYSFTAAGIEFGASTLPLLNLFNGALVSGQFNYDSSAAQTGNTAITGAALYTGSITNLSATIALASSVDGLDFSAQRGATVVGDERSLGDFLVIASGLPDDGGTLIGFVAEGYTLELVGLRWFESSLGIQDFLSSENLPTSPPSFDGALRFSFVDESGQDGFFVSFNDLRVRPTE